MNAEKVVRNLRTGIKFFIIASVVVTFVNNFIPRTADTIVIGTSEQFHASEQAVVQVNNDETPADTSVAVVSSAESVTAVTSSTAVKNVTTTPAAEPVTISDKTAGEYAPAESETTHATVRAQTSPVNSEQTEQTKQTEPTEQAQPDLINVNTATAEELMMLNGIGEVKAQAIIDYREEHGRFSNVDELINVKGIGEKTLEKIRSSVTV